MNAKKIGVTIFVLMLCAGAVLSFAPIAHAASPVESLLGSLTCTGSSCTATVTASAQTTIIIQTSIFTAVTVTGVTDTLGLSYTNAQIMSTPACALLCNTSDEETWYALTSSNSGSDTITVTLTGSGYSWGFGKVEQINIPVYSPVIGANSGTSVGIYSNTILGVTASFPANGIVTAFLTDYGCLVDCTSLQTTTPTSTINSPLISVSSGSTGQGNGHPVFEYFTAYYSSSSGLSGQFYSTTLAEGTANVQHTYGLSVIAWTSAPVSSTQTQTIGSCTANTGGTYLTNSTQYWYAGNALGQEAVSSITTQIENIKGSGSHTLQLLVYVTAANPGAQTPSVNYPAILAYSQSFVITSGTTNSTITLNVNIPLNTANVSPLPFNFWSVGIVGDDHIRIHNSAVSGMTTQTGAASTASQPSQFTGPGSTSTKKLQLCATGNYQSVISGPTTTTTAQASTTTTASTTSTIIISTISANLFASSSNWPVIFLILLLPAGLFMGISRSLTGLLAGLMVGAIMGILMGIIPNYVFVGLVIAIVAIAFLSRGRDN